MKLVYILLLIGLVKVIMLYKFYGAVPVTELKRLARSGNKRAQALYKVAVYEDTLDLFLWLAGIALAAVLLVWSVNTNLWLAVTLVVIIGAFGVLFPAPRWQGWFGALTAITAKYQTAFLSFINPVFGRIANLLPLKQDHTGLYEKKDLLDMLKRQLDQPDNRINAGDLKIAEGAMTFGDKTVGSVMTPRRQVVFAKADDQVGPVLVDELHKTGFSRFPVAKDSAKTAMPQIIGTLYLNNLVGYNGDGKVKELMKHDVYFVNEDASLRQALQAFLKTHHHLLIVVNSFEEMVGVLSLEDVLEQILGKQIMDEFDSYDNLRAVASMHAHQESKQNDTIQPEQTAETEG